MEAWFKEAREAAQVDKDTPHYHEEIAAYAVEEFMRKPSSLPDVIKRWVKTLIAKVKQLIAETTGRVHQSYSSADFAAAELKRMGKEADAKVDSSAKRDYHYNNNEYTLPDRAREDMVNEGDGTAAERMDRDVPASGSIQPKVKLRKSGDWSTGKQEITSGSDAALYL